MEEGPYAALQKEWWDTITAWVKATDRVKELVNTEPALEDGEQIKWQDELARAIREEKHAHEAYVKTWQAYSRARGWS